MAIYQYKGKTLFNGALTTTLTTTLVTGNEPTHVTSIKLSNTNTTTARAVTVDASGSVICPAVLIPPNTVLELLDEKGIFLEDGDDIRGGQGVGTDVIAYISGVQRVEIG